jgi:hypothetical protein
MIKQLMCFVVLVGLPNANIIDLMKISKSDYTTPHDDCQQAFCRETMKFNYITTEDWISNNIKNYQKILREGEMAERFNATVY